MMIYTPGPWDNIPKSNHEGKPWTYVIIAGDDDTEVAEVMLPGDSNLIAAAPELLAVAEKFRDVMKENESDIRIQTRGVMDIVLGDIFLEFDAAIAKARGES